MSHFRGTVQGSRGKVSRLGGKDSGVTTECNGWDRGVRVVSRVDALGDCFDIYATSGSDSGGLGVKIATVHDNNAVIYDEKNSVIDL